MSVLLEAKKWLEDMKAHTNCCGTPIVRNLITEIERLTDISNAAAIVFSHFEPKDGPGEAAKALLKMELGLKDGK